MKKTNQKRTFFLLTLMLMMAMPLGSSTTMFTEDLLQLRPRTK